MLTEKQIKAITNIQLHNLWSKDYEVKDFRLRSMGSFVSVVVETGRKDDEGTMAAILCRSRGHFFVFRGGRIKAADPMKDKVTKAVKYPLIYGWRT